MSVAATRPPPFSPSSGGEAENWDDDFLFQAEDSPAKAPRSRPKKEGGPSHTADRRWSGQSQTDTLAWDEELEREEAERQSSAGSSSLGQAAGAAVDLSQWAEGDDDDDAEFGFASRRVSEVHVPEDTVSPLPVFPHNPVASNSLPSPSKRTRTNTSPSRSSTSTSRSASARSSPLMPTRQIPSSPALSLFSMSTSTAQPYTPSLTGSTAHLRHTRSRDASSPVGAFVPTEPRVPRRRLRKKSRPARPGDIAEDEAPTGYVMRSPSPHGLGLAMAEEEEASWSESSNPQERTPSPVHSPVAGPSSPPTKTPLLSRIGSLKNRLNRRPKGSSSSPPSSTGPPTTPGRPTPTRTSTTPHTPRPRAPSWFRPSQGSSPEDQAPGLTHRRSKEPFWKNVGSFSSGRSPVDPSESDHESTVKKPPRKSLANSRPPLDVFPRTEEVPSLPVGPTSPTPGAKLAKPRRPISMGGPNRPSAPPTNRTVASLGRGTGLGWASTLNDAEEKEKENSILRSLRKFSGHGRKRSGEMPRVPSSSAGTTSSRVPSSSNMSSRRPSLSLSAAAAGVARTASMSSPTTNGPRAAPMLKSASAIVLSSAPHHAKEYHPGGSVFTLPLAMDDPDEHEDTTEQGPATVRPSMALDRPSLTVEPPEVESPRELSFDRPNISLDLRPPTPHSRPSSPLVLTRPITPQMASRPSTPQSTKPPGPAFQSTPHGARVMTPYSARPSSPLATRNPTTPLNRTHELTPEEEDEYLDGLEPVPEGEVSRYNALDESAQQDWLDAVAALPTPDPDFPVPDEPLGRLSLSSNSNGRPSISSLGRKSSSTESGYRHSNSISSRSKIHRKSSSLAHGHSKSVSEPGRDLLPPIELQPPSPPQTLSNGSLALLGKKHSRLGSSTSPMGHSSSLSRASTQPGGSIDGSMLRRNSLSDLKIPARISRAQSGLKSNLGMVREFASCIEQIRGLQSMYRNLLADLKYAIENNEPLSPVLFPPASRSSATSATLVRVPSRDIGRVTDRLNSIDERYSLWWECADILVELGGGSSGRDSDHSPSNQEGSKDGSTKSRERAITLAGNQAAPSVEPQVKKDQWYKDRGELSPRQLQILREMLSTPNPSLLHVPASTGYLNALHPGGTASAITLPSSSNSSHVHGPKTDSKQKPGGKIRRASRAGITGIRDLLKHLNLKKPSSDASKLGADSKSQINLGLGSQSRVNLPQAAQSQLNLGSGSQTNLPRLYGSRSQGPAPNKVSPRRPSLASIFRLNGRSKSKGRVVSTPSATPSSNTSAAEDDESDWDRMDSASDLDLRGKIPEDLKGKEKEEKDATLRGRKSGSGGRVSNVDRPPVPALPAQFAKSAVSLSPHEGQHTIPQVRKASGGKRPPIPIASGSGKSVEPGLRSAPLSPSEGLTMGGPLGAGVEGRLALTPENIKPLLEYAREVTARLGACVNELRELGMVDPDKLTA